MNKMFVVDANVIPKIATIQNYPIPNFVNHATTSQNAKHVIIIMHQMKSCVINV
jgi:hypothetical protein